MIEKIDPTISIDCGGPSVSKHLGAAQPPTEANDAQAQTAHTPGPWEVYTGLQRDAHWHDRACVWSTRAGHLVAYTDFITADVAEANARLIAAAPDMLAALQRIALLPPLQSIGPDGAVIEHDAERQIARAAIAKATDHTKGEG